MLRLQGNCLLPTPVKVTQAFMQLLIVLTMIINEQSFTMRFFMVMLIFFIFCFVLVLIVEYVIVLELHHFILLRMTWWQSSFSLQVPMPMLLEKMVRHLCIMLAEEETRRQ
mgnify:CR=1 FL=1